MRLPQANEGNEYRCLENHVGDNISKMLLIIKPGKKLSFCEVKAKARMRLFQSVLVVAGEEEKDIQVHTQYSENANEVN